MRRALSAAAARPASAPADLPLAGFAARRRAEAGGEREPVAAATGIHGDVFSVADLL
jgi:hypothetical protein